MNNQAVKILLIGAGSRGEVYSRYALEFPDKMTVVAVAEPRQNYRDTFAAKHKISKDLIFTCWEEALVKGKIADAVMICTQDKLHIEPALAFSKQEYAILLEKPMSPDEQECKDIIRSVKKNNVLFSVCHVLRYTRYTQKLKAILNEGHIGSIVSMQHLEPVGWWHQAHSFVRGNWRNEKESSSMLLQKSCHDIDWIRYMMDSPISAVHSFGSLSHFTQKNHPENAGENCFTCGVESNCPYSAKKIYIEEVYGDTTWAKNVVNLDQKSDVFEASLKNGPYARCVYLCDNDVVDHQVVNFEFIDGKTASLTMTAFTEYADRKTRIFGSRGRIEGNGETIKVLDFTSNTEKEYIVDDCYEKTSMDGHGGGDFYLIQQFIEAVINNDQTKILSGPLESLETHLAVFAAEKSRKNKQVISL